MISRLKNLESSVHERGDHEESGEIEGKGEDERNAIRRTADRLFVEFAYRKKKRNLRGRGRKGEREGE